MTEYEKDLWMKEYDRCRDHGAAVSIACKVADDAVREISKRMGMTEKPALSGHVELTAGLYKWADRQLYVMVNGNWEFAGQVFDDGEWMTYRPDSDIEDDSCEECSRGVVSRKYGESSENLERRAMCIVLFALDWSAYGLKRPEGL